MRTAVRCGLALLIVAPAFAQTTASNPADPDRKIVTLTGCVGGGVDARPITLSHALLVPATSPVAPRDPSPLPAPVSSTETQPPDPTLPPPTAAVVPPLTTASAVGTSGTKTPAPSTSSRPSGVITGTAPAGSSGSSVTGYRLSGADMQPWIGKRVQLTGTFVPAPAESAAPAGTSATVTGAAAMPPLLEFRIQSVQPATGTCEKE